MANLDAEDQPKRFVDVELVSKENLPVAYSAFGGFIRELKIKYAGNLWP